MSFDKAELTEILREVLHEQRAIDDDKHELHHEFIEMELQRREARKKLWERFKLSFVGGVALAILAGLGWVGQLVLGAIKHNH